MLIAQISDLHARPPGRPAYGTVDTNGMLERALSAILAMTPRPDCVLATGDLTDCGLEAEYGVLRELLAALPMPVFVIPGNHDRRETLARVLGDRFRYLPEAGGFLNYVIEDFPVRLIAVDSVVAGRPHGRLCKTRLAWLEQRLDEDAGRPTVIFMHHPPFATGVEAMDEIGCLDGAVLAAMVVRRSNVERLLCGHYHRPITVRWAGTIGFAAPSTAHQVALDLRPGQPTRFVMEPPGLALHSWSVGGGIVTHTVPIGDYGPAFDVVLDPHYPGAAVT